VFGTWGNLISIMGRGEHEKNSTTDTEREYNNSREIEISIDIMEKEKTPCVGAMLFFFISFWQYTWGF